MHFADQSGVLVLFRFLFCRGEPGHTDLLGILPDYEQCYSFTVSWNIY